MSALPITKTMDEQKDCPLFLLPPELRNQIYKLALCSEKPKEKTMSQLPAENPYEVIKLQEAPNLQPKNELLATCRRIHDESRGLFLATQRSFWASNNFMVELRDDWGNKSNTVVESKAEITRLRYEYFSLMPRIVISVKTTMYEHEHHLVRRQDGSLALAVILKKGDSSLNGNLSSILASIEHIALALIVYGVEEKAISSTLNRKTAHATRYGLMAQKYFSMAANRREAGSRNRKHMLKGLYESLDRIAAERSRYRELLPRTTLIAVVQHLCECLEVQLEPRN